MNLPPQLGIRANLPQFSLLVLINAFVGAMVGIERSILPLVAEQEFGIASRSAILSFLISFGIIKAISNLLAGTFSDHIGRKKLLVTGWIIGMPVPFMLMWAPSWSWIIAANILLGINQGLCWSTTVIMKIDLAGPKQRGLAMGLNEFAGYLAVGGAAYWSASIAASHGLRPYPFYLGIGFSLLGFLLSISLVKETSKHAEAESQLNHNSLPQSSKPEPGTTSLLPFKQIFFMTSWKNKNLFSCSQAGLVNNLNDGVAWGLFPLFFATIGLSLGKIGMLTALYPATWGSSQLITGALSDRIGRKWLIAAGMWLQASAILLIVSVTEFAFQAMAAVLLGLGTAMVYPTLLAAVGDVAHPSWRASAVGVYRLWRDLGYAVGAVLAGLIADQLGMKNAILAAALLTFASGVVVMLKFQDRTRPS